MPSSARKKKKTIKNKALSPKKEILNSVNDGDLITFWKVDFDAWSSSDCRIATLNLFFFNETATTEIYTLSLHDALPILRGADAVVRGGRPHRGRRHRRAVPGRSEEHTSDLQSRRDLVCRRPLERKK